MSSTQPTPTPILPVRLVLTATGGVVTAGRADFTPAPGQRVIEVPDDRYAAFVAVVSALAADEEVTYDEAARTFARRARVLSAAEQAEAADKSARATRLARLDADIAGFGALDPAGRAAAQLNTMAILRAVVRRLMGE